MLNAMFKEIQSRLGDEVGLFREFNPQPWRVKEYREKYKNLGVLYVNNGNLNKMPGGAMMDVSYTLELFMQVPETYNNSDPIVLPLENLATGVTGKIYTDDGSGYQFILDVGLPTSDGSLRPGQDCNYVSYVLPITAVFTNGIALSDNNSIEFTIDGVKYDSLESVISFVEAPQTQLETSTFVAQFIKFDSSAQKTTYPAMQNESAVIATSWNAQISKLFRPDQPADLALRKLILDTPRKVITVTYKANGKDETRTRNAILHDCVFTNELGQATYLTINLSTAMREV